METTLVANHSASNYRGFFFISIIVVLISIGVFRIVSTYSVFWQTEDVPIHISSGMQLIEKGIYTYERLHPPFARVVSSLVPYLYGLRGAKEIELAGLNKDDVPWIDGNLILHQGDLYEFNLSLTRVGTLPFFILGTLVTLFWAKSIGGWIAAIFASLIFTTSPSILANSGVAGLDMICATMIVCSLFLTTKWLTKPNILYSVLLGICLGLAFISKLSAIAYLGLSIGLIVFFYYIIPLIKKSNAPNTATLSLGQLAIKTALIAIVCLITIWAGYRFSTDHLVNPNDKPYMAADKLVGEQGTLHDFTYFIIDNSILPAPEFFKALIVDLPLRSQKGHVSYLLGEVRQYGWWYYYLIVLLYKLTIPFIILSLIGVVSILRSPNKSPEDRIKYAPLHAIVGILIVSALSTVNLGIRQILCIIPCMAVVAGVGAKNIISQKDGMRNIVACLVALLLIWQVVSSIRSHPDYLAYFNELAGNKPEDILVVCDLDWGQDLKRLHQSLKEKEVKEFKVMYNGSFGIDLNKFGFPKHSELIPYKEETGWVAISITELKRGTHKPPYDQFAWLNKYNPVEIVGKSIWLYNIPDK